MKASNSNPTLLTASVPKSTIQSALLIFEIINPGNLSTIMYLSGCVFTIQFILSLTLTEPKIHSDKFDKSNFTEIKNAFQLCFLKNRKLKWLIISSAIFGVSTLTAFWLSQPFFIQQGIDIKYFGLLIAIYQIPVAFASLKTPQLEEKIGHKTIPILLTTLLFISYFTLGLSLTVIGILAYLMLSIVRGITRTHFSTLINHNIPS